MNISLHAFRDDAPEAQRLATALGMPLTFVDVHTFPDGETAPCVPVTTPTTLVYRSLHQPNAKFLELLLAVDAWRRNGAKRLVLIAPYLPYMRQDAVFRAGEPISQKVVAHLLDAAFDRIITVDPHLHRTSSLAELFPTCETTCLFGADALARHYRQRPPPASTLVIGPDVESGPWVNRIAGTLGLEYATLRKHRHGDSDVVIDLPDKLSLADRPVLLVDDICSTGGTLHAAISLLKRADAGPITVFVTHALGSANVTDALLRAGAASVLSTDSCPGVTGTVHLAALIAEALPPSDVLA